MTTAYDKYLSHLQEASNNASNLQNLVNEQYEETRAGFEAKAKIGEDILEGIIGYEAIGGLKGLYGKMKKKLGRRRQNANENENQDQAQAQEDGGNPDAPAPANEQGAIDDGMADVGDDFEFVQPADVQDMLTDQAGEMLGQGNDLVGDDMADMTEMTDMGPLTRPTPSAQQQMLDFDPDDVGGLSADQTQALDDFGGGADLGLDDATDISEAVGSGVGGVVVPEEAFGQVQGARDQMARILRGEGVDAESGPVADVAPDIFDADFQPDWVQALPADADLGEGMETVPTIAPTEAPQMPNLDDFVAQDVDAPVPATTADVAPDVAPAVPEAVADVAPAVAPDVVEAVPAVAPAIAEEAPAVAEAVAPAIAEDLGEDLTLGAVLGPIGEAGAVVYGIYQTVEALLGLGKVHKAVVPTQAGISMIPEGNLPTTTEE